MVHIFNVAIEIAMHSSFASNFFNFQFLIFWFS